MIPRIADFLDKRSLPNPVELSPAAKTQLVVPEKPLRYAPLVEEMCI
jgi:hypothetical protein